MDNSLSKDRYLYFLKANFLPLLLGVGGLTFLGYGLIVSTVPNQNKEDILFEAATTVSPQAKVASNAHLIVVDVEGAVIKPGIYKLEANSRVHDALIAAGGLATNADREKVTTSLNLASKLVDGGKIYIPFEGEDAQVSSGQSVSGNAVLGIETGNGVNINTATQKELEALPGIGEVTAKKIIDGRPYGGITELEQKKIVGKKVFGQIKDKITAN